MWRLHRSRDRGGQDVSCGVLQRTFLHLRSGPLPKGRYVLFPSRGSKQASSSSSLSKHAMGGTEEADIKAAFVETSDLSKVLTCKHAVE